VNWGRSVFLGTALAAVGTVAVLTLAHLRPHARSEGRDPLTQGGIPLVKAEPGPVKVKPQDPGGLKVPHKDKSIYEQIEGHRKVVPAADPAKGAKSPPHKGTASKVADKKMAQAIGPYRVQLGSFDSAETAEKRWQELKRRHADLVGSLTMVVERVELKAKGTMYRLQAGPLKSPEDVQKLCGALTQRKVACFLVKS
jgi:cell division septation protein DedD